MSSSPNRLARFWQELKRRKVLRSLAIYAGTAYVIFEASTIIFPRWGLPDWAIDLVLYLIVLGAIINVIIAWFYDISSEGFQKTKSLEEAPEDKQRQDSRGWKAATYISLVVIVGLIIFNVFTSGKALRAGDIRSLVVLPFDNFTGDDELEYFVSGMHASLISDMGQLGGLQVKSRTSSSAFKGMDMTISEITSELRADAALETAVMCLGDTICVQFRLLSTIGDEEQLWIGDYKEEKSQILNLYNRITKQIAQEVMVELTADEKRRLDRIKTVDKEAYDAYLKSYAHWDDMGEEGTRKAIEYLNLAIEKDPDWAPLWSGLAQAIGVRIQFGYESPETGLPKVYGYLNKALKLDPDYADIHFNNAIFGAFTEWNWEKGEKEFLKALAINPNDAMSRVFYAHLLSILQRGDEALSQGRLAMELDPFNPSIQSMYAAVLAQNGDWEASLLHLEKALVIEPRHYLANYLLEFVAYHCGKYDKVFEALRRSIPLEEKFFDSIETIYQEQGFEMAYEKMLNRMELLDIGSPCSLASRYSALHQYEKVLDWLEKGYEVHDSNMPYIATEFNSYDSLFDHPRFLAIMEKMNLPLPPK